MCPMPGPCLPRRRYMSDWQEPPDTSSNTGIDTDKELRCEDCSLWQWWNHLWE